MAEGKFVSSDVSIPVIQRRQEFSKEQLNLHFFFSYFEALKQYHKMYF